jgi:L-ascorbate metabolism protein UlaG (beta-lactamase superfamily)
LWIGKPLKVLLHEDGFYEGILMAEQKNGLLIETSGKRVYISYDSVVSLEEL